MREFSFEPIIVLIIFILIPLADYVLERMRREVASRATNLARRLEGELEPGDDPS